VIFTAGIGQHASAFRAAVIQPLEVLGLTLDAAANETCDVADGPVVISPAGRSPAVLVVATVEELMIARETARLVG
ncbi:MAG TPA: hypothetical protein VMM13_16735, partial [Euzebya sp.]|nr:hypothetical protein [Euzebya sp.]